jgi:hydroxymethylglutaryl-CoA reductase (NADPH)
LNEAQDVKKLIEEISNKQPIKEGSATIMVSRPSVEAQQQNITILEKESGAKLEYLRTSKVFNTPEKLAGNIENFIGMTQVPTGIIGPMKVIGSIARGEFYVPLATSEGALVASYHRGAKATRLSGGVTSVCLVESVQRSPLFKFKNMGELGTFLLWTMEQVDKFREITEATSKYAKLLDIRTNIEGNHLIMSFEFHPGDAAGQNMVTFCTDEICKYIVEHAPIRPLSWFIESNYSGDKKATAAAFTNVRGKKVSAEVHLSREIVSEVLKTTPEAMAAYWQASTIGVIQSGAIGAQGHFANGLAAVYLACGQDVACISESSVGITRMEVTPEDMLYVSVTLPNVIVGTVGGGTSLPTQRECLELIGCYGEGKARKFAEICGALVLCGEISIAAALSVGHFATAHKNLGRSKNNNAK